MLAIAMASPNNCQVLCPSTKKQCQRPGTVQHGQTLMCKHHHNEQKRKEECAICCEDMKPSSSIILECGHVFHMRCIEQWGKDDQHETCPLCRRPFSTQVLQKIHVSDLDLLGYAIYSLPPLRRRDLIENINYAIMSAHLLQPMPQMAVVVEGQGDSDEVVMVETNSPRL